LVVFVNGERERERERGCNCGTLIAWTNRMFWTYEAHCLDADTPHVAMAVLRRLEHFIN